jgi:DNA processing protein
MDDPVVLTLAALQAQGLGAGRLAILRDTFGSVAAALGAAAAGAPAPPGVPSSLFRRLPEEVELTAAARRVRTIRAAGVDLVCWDDARYPAPLWLDDAAPPPLLYVQGSLPATLAEPAHRVRAAAVVGTRRPTARGLALARELAAALANLGVTVVSGLALGIDGAAHEGALEAAGATVAVLGAGHRHLHPPSHRGLARRIVERGGALLSEHPPDARPERHHFPERNRLVSGLSRLIVVVEAGLRSGTRSTAEHARRQHRDVYACPGRPGGTTFAGTLQLLRDGALLVTEHEDVLFRFRPGSGGVEAEAATSTEPTRTADAPLLEALYAVEEATLDELAGSARLSFGRLAGRLTALEIAGSVVRTAGGRYRLATAERQRRDAQQLREEADRLTN